MSTTRGPSDESESVATLRRAVGLAVTSFDAAESYGVGADERLVGRALAPMRSEAVLATKDGFGYDRHGRLAIRAGRPDHLKAAVEGSERRLGLDDIDLVYLHRIDPSVPIEETVAALAELVRAGTIGHIGLSEASAATIRRAHDVHPIAAVLTEYSEFERGVEVDGVLETARELGIGFVSYCPVGTRLPDRYVPARAPPRERLPQ